jgi:hypothetical protein
MAEIDELYQRYKQAIDQAEGPTLQAELQDSFKRLLLVGSASYFESKIQEVILSFSEKHLGKKHILHHFINNKGIIRQYHTYFEWDGGNANKFFALFGTNFRDYMKQRITKDAQLKQSIGDFLKLGYLRNQMTHENMLNYNLDKTLEEIYELYQTASFFVDSLPQFFTDYLATLATDPAPDNS